MTLPETELNFYFAAVAQLEPAWRPVFAERVAQVLGAHPPARVTLIARSEQHSSDCGRR
jgi:hypothetical protein